MPIFEPTYVLDNPPILPDTRGVQRDLFKWANNRPRGRTVLKELGVYSLVDAASITQARFDAADVVYLGGHIYTVTQAEADALTAAGYAVLPDPVTPSLGTPFWSESGEEFLTEDGQVMEVE